MKGRKKQPDQTIRAHCFLPDDWFEGFAPVRSPQLRTAIWPKLG